jgi:hypothetical protein
MWLDTTIYIADRRFLYGAVVIMTCAILANSILYLGKGLDRAVSMSPVEIAAVLVDTMGKEEIKKETDTDIDLVLSKVGARRYHHPKYSRKALAMPPGP